MEPVTCNKLFVPHVRYLGFSQFWGGLFVLLFCFVLTKSYPVQIAVEQRNWQFSFLSLGRMLGQGFSDARRLGEEKFCFKLLLRSHQRKVLSHSCCTEEEKWAVLITSFWRPKKANWLAVQLVVLLFRTLAGSPRKKIAQVFPWGHFCLSFSV